MTNDLSIPNPQSCDWDAKTVGGQIAVLDRMIPDMVDGTTYREIGDRLRRAMQQAGYKSAAALARALNEEESRVRNWVNGHARLPIDEAQRLKRLLRVSLDWIYEGDPSGLPQALYAALVGIEVANGPARKRAKKHKARPGACIVPITRHRQEAK